MKIIVSLSETEQIILSDIDPNITLFDLMLQIHKSNESGTIASCLVSDKGPFLSIFDLDRSLCDVLGGEADRTIVAKEATHPHHDLSVQTIENHRLALLKANLLLSDRTKFRQHPDQAPSEMMKKTFLEEATRSNKTIFEQAMPYLSEQLRAIIFEYRGDEGLYSPDFLADRYMIFCSPSADIKPGLSTAKSFLTDYSEMGAGQNNRLELQFVVDEKEPLLPTKFPIKTNFASAQAALKDSLREDTIIIHLKHHNIIHGIYFIEPSDNKALGGEAIHSQLSFKNLSRYYFSVPGKIRAALKNSLLHIILSNALDEGDIYYPEQSVHIISKGGYYGRLKPETFFLHEHPDYGMVINIGGYYDPKPEPFLYSHSDDGLARNYFLECHEGGKTRWDYSHSLREILDHALNSRKAGFFKKGMHTKATLLNVLGKNDDWFQEQDLRSLETAFIAVTHLHYQASIRSRKQLFELQVIKPGRLEEAEEQKIAPALASELATTSLHYEALDALQRVILKVVADYHALYTNKRAYSYQQASKLSENILKNADPQALVLIFLNSNFLRKPDSLPFFKGKDSDPQCSWLKKCIALEIIQLKNMPEALIKKADEILSDGFSLNYHPATEPEPQGPLL